MAEPLLDDDGNPSDVAETLLDADSEIASTVIDVSSDNEDDDCGPDGTFLNLYCRVMPHFRTNLDLVNSCLHGNRIIWRLQKPGADPQLHIDLVLEDQMTVARRRFGTRARFKIGLTFKPWDRIAYDDYKHPDKTMIIVLVSESSDFIADQETVAIDRYRKFGRKGVIENAAGNDSCENRIRGGGSAFHGYSPHYLYLVTGPDFGWHASSHPA